MALIHRTTATIPVPYNILNKMRKSTVCILPQAVSKCFFAPFISMTITPDFSDNKNIRAWDSRFFEPTTDIFFVATSVNQQCIHQDKTKTNVYYNCGSQEAGLVKHRLHKMNSRHMVQYKTCDTHYTVQLQHKKKN